MPRTRSLAWSELKVGIVAVVALILSSVLILSVGGRTGFFWQQYQLHTVFADVQGLRKGALVRLAGVDVGDVREIELVGAEVRVTMELLEEIQPSVTTESRASLSSLSLLGETIVVISPAAAGVPLASGAHIPSVPAPAQIGDVAADATGSLEQITELLRSVREGEGTVGRLFTDETLYAEARNAIDELEDILGRIGEGRGTLGQLVQDPEAYRRLEATLANLQKITSAITERDGTLGRLVYDDSLANTLGAAATNLRELTASLQKGQGTLGALMNDRALYNRLNEIAGRFEQVATSLQQGQGTLGRLLEDPTLYENVNAAATELRALLSDIREDPRRYLNVRVSVF